MTRMNRDDLLSEVEWQLSFGMDPIFISEQLSKTPAAIYKAAWRAGNVRIASHFNSGDTKSREKGGE